MARKSVQSVDDYLAAQPEANRAALQSVRAAIRKAVPQAEESISYQIPTYKLRNNLVIYFAGWKRHYSLYPASPELLAKFAAELTPYEIQKSTIRFPLDQPVPVKLIARLAKFRAAQLAAPPDRT